MTAAQTIPDIASTAPRESARDRTNARLGMVVFIMSWAMGVAVLVVSFLVLRDRQPAWPPEGVKLPSLPVALVATGLLVASSFTLHRAVDRLRRGFRQVNGLWAATLILGLVFSGLQYWLWMDLWTAGHQPWAAGMFESAFYGLTWFHAAHVISGLLALVVGQIGLATGRYGTHKTSTVANIATFWHFVDVVWIILFVCFFVL